MTKGNTYVGIYDDEFGGMTYIGGIIKDGWIFGLIPESETGTGWTPAMLEALADKVQVAWGQYQHSVRLLPPDIRARHERIHQAAIERARQAGWEPMGDDDEP